MIENNSYPPNTIYINKTFDGVCPKELLDRLNVNENQLLRKLLRRGELLKKDSPSLDARNTYLEIHAYGSEWMIGVYHGKRSIKGLTYKQELYLLYLENGWKQTDTARVKYGRESDPVAEIILNGYDTEEEFMEALKSGEYVPTKAMKKEAKERNKHNKDKDYICESYQKLLDEMEVIREAYWAKG